MSEVERTIQLRGQEMTLRAFAAERLIEWMELLAECGKVTAQVMGATDVNRDDISKLIHAGVVLAGLSLGDQALAASLTEEERREVITMQDELNRSSVLVPMFAVQQASARAYLGMSRG